MFIRRDRKTTRTGQQRVHVSLAHNVRERLPDGTSRPKPIVFARLGEESDLDADTVRGMRDALDRYLRLRFGDEAADAAPVATVADDVRQMAVGLRFLASRAFGMRAVMEPIWKDLGLERALRGIGKEHDTRFPFERVVFSMVLNRLVDPGSKRACNEWVRNEAWLPELADVDVQHFYRAMDLMQAHSAQILDAIGRAAREGCDNDELALLLVDTTTTYLETDYDDAERAQILDEWNAYLQGEADKPSVPMPTVVNEPAKILRGHSKDKKARLPQVKIGLVTTASGRPVDVQTFAGNASDQKLTLGLLEAARGRLPGQRLAAVMDSGMGGTPNLKAIDALEPRVDRISAVPLRNSKMADEMLLSRPGRWRRHPYKQGFFVRDVIVDADATGTGRAERWIATRNAADAARSQRVLERELAVIKSGLAEDDRVNGHGRPVCRLLANGRRRRLLKPNKKGTKLLLDRDRVRVERRRAGVHVIRSTLVDETVETSLRAYDAQYGIEHEFRTLKTPLRLRPMHHRAARRIDAHVLMCAMSLMVVRELERRTGETLDTIRKTVGRVRVAEVQQGRTRFWQREEWSPEALVLLEAVGATAGPRTWGATKEGRP